MTSFKVRYFRKKIPEEKVIDLLSDECPKPEKFSVYSVEHRLQEVPFARIFRIEKFQKLEDKFLRKKCNQINNMVN